MGETVKRVNEENYQPQYVPQAFKVINGQTRDASAHMQEIPVGVSNGLEYVVDGITLVQLPATRLKQAVAFYVEVLGMPLEYPDRPVERNTFVQTMPRIGPGLHILETPVSEFRHLHAAVNGRSEEYVAFYAKNLQQLHERLCHAGVEINSERSDGYMSFLDPEGHLIGVYERQVSDINDRFESNITGFRHVQMLVADPLKAAAFFEEALGFERRSPDGDAIYIAISSDEINQPMIRLVQAAGNPHLMHWTLDGRPKHALELHSKNIGALRDRILERGGSVTEDLEFTGCGGYLKFQTPDGHYIWVNQDRRYCGY